MMVVCNDDDIQNCSWKFKNKLSSMSRAHYDQLTRISTAQLCFEIFLQQIFPKDDA